MNPLLSLQARAREILLAAPTLSGATILIEDREGMAFDIESSLATLSAPLLIIGSVSGTQSQSAAGILMLQETIVVSLLYRPLIAAQADPDSPLPSDILTDAVWALHEAEIDPATAYPGSPVFRVTAHALADSDSTDGLVTQTITLTAPLVLRPQSSQPQPTTPA